MRTAVIEEDGLGQLVLLGQREDKSLQQGLAQLLSTLAHLVGREDHHRIGAGVRGAGRCFLFFCRRLTHGEQDAVFPLGQLFGGRPVAFLLGHFGEVLDGDLVVHEHFDFACAI